MNLPNEFDWSTLALSAPEIAAAIHEEFDADAEDFSLDCGFSAEALRSVPGVSELFAVAEMSDDDQISAYVVAAGNLALAGEIDTPMGNPSCSVKFYKKIDLSVPAWVAVSVRNGSFDDFRVLRAR